MFFHFPQITEPLIVLSPGKAKFWASLGIALLPLSAVTLVSAVTLTLLPLPPSMINADFCAGAVLISFGAVLGKTGPAQLLIMALLEVVLFSVNEFVLLSLLEVCVQGRLWGRGRDRGSCMSFTLALPLQVRDAGGSMTIHTFGAYFGLVLSRVLYRPQLEKSKHRQSSVYHSDLFAMIGEAGCGGVGGPLTNPSIWAREDHLQARPQSGCCLHALGFSPFQFGICYMARKSTERALVEPKR